MDAGCARQPSCAHFTLSCRAITFPPVSLTWVSPTHPHLHLISLSVTLYIPAQIHYSSARLSSVFHQAFLPACMPVLCLGLCFWTFDYPACPSLDLFAFSGWFLGLSLACLILNKRNFTHILTDLCRAFGFLSAILTTVLSIKVPVVNRLNHCSTVLKWQDSGW